MDRRSGSADNSSRAYSYPPRIDWRLNCIVGWVVLLSPMGRSDFSGVDDIELCSSCASGLLRSAWSRLRVWGLRWNVRRNSYFTVLLERCT